MTSEVHTPEPGDEHRARPGSSPGSLLNRDGGGLEAPHPPTFDVCGIDTGRVDATGPIDCPKPLPCPDHPVVNEPDYHPWRCGANCEVCADRGDR